MVKRNKEINNNNNNKKTKMFINWLSNNLLEYIVKLSDNFDSYDRICQLVPSFSDDKRRIRIVDNFTMIRKSKLRTEYLLNGLLHREHDKPAYTYHNKKTTITCSNGIMKEKCTAKKIIELSCITILIVKCVL